MEITTFETINGKHMIEVVRGKYVYGFEGTARQVETILVQLYQDPKRAFSKLLKFAEIK